MDDFVTLTGESADGASASSAGASFSDGPAVDSDIPYARAQAASGAGPGPGSAPAAGYWSTMRAMSVLQRGETTTGPVAVGGRTITLVARTTAVHLGGDSRGALHIRSRPMHVEVLDEDGQRHVVRVRDVEHTLVRAIAIGAVAVAYALRTIRKSLDRRA